MRPLQKSIIASVVVALAFALTYLAFAPHTRGGDAPQQIATSAPATPAVELQPEPGPSTDSSLPTTAAPADPYAPVPGVDHQRQGRQLFWNRDYAAAALELERAVRQEPGRYRPYYLLGLAYQRLGETAAAERAYITAREIDTSRPEVLVNLARLYLDIDLPGDALEMAEAAVEVDSTNSSAWNQCGRAQLQLGDGDKAVTAFETACRLDPQNAYAWNNLGYAHIQLGAFDAAIVPLERAVALRDDVAFMFNNLGVALERQARFAEAIEAYTHAAELSPGHVAEQSLARLMALLPAAALAGDGEASATTTAIAATDGAPTDVVPASVRSSSMD